MRELTAKQIEALRVLEKTNGSIQKSAQMLGIARTSFGNRIKQIMTNAGIDPLCAAERRRLLEKIGEQVERGAGEAERKPFKKCNRPCRFRSATPHLNGCDFFYLTHVRRGCPAGEECTRFESGERMEDRFEYGRAFRPSETITKSEIETYTRQQRRRHLEIKAQQGK